MYEARQNKEKVSRRVNIDGSGIQQRIKMDDRRIITVLQRIPLTRGQLEFIVSNMLRFQNDGDAISFLNLNIHDDNDKMLIWDHYRVKSGRSIETPFIDDMDELQYEDAHEEDMTIGNPEHTGEELKQLKRAPNRVSAAKSFTSPNVNYIAVSYKTDNKGGIDFETPNSHILWQLPVDKNSEVDLSSNKGTNFPSNINSSDYGMLQNGKYVQIRGASRNQHFNIANRLTNNTIFGSNSPTNMTWHHLENYPHMVLVDRNVHAKYGHNGGYYLW